MDPRFRGDDLLGVPVPATCYLLPVSCLVPPVFFAVPEPCPLNPEPSPPPVPAYCLQTPFGSGFGWSTTTR
jgi:hypothetical protein